MEQNINSKVSSITNLDVLCTDSEQDVYPFHSLLKRNNEKISLVNFNPTSKEPYYFDSPRSLEACRVQGIDPNELLIKTLEDIKDEPIPPQFNGHREEFLDLKLVFYEKSRQNKLNLCLQTREKLIECETKASSVKERSIFTDPLRTPTRSSVSKEGNESHSPPLYSLESERKKIDETQKKQNRFIEFIIEDQRRQHKKCNNMYVKLLKIKELKDERMSDLQRRKEEARQDSMSRELNRSEESLEKMRKIQQDIEMKREKHEAKIKLARERMEILKEEEGINREMNRKHREERLVTKMEEYETKRAAELSVKRLSEAQKTERKQQMAQEKKEEQIKQKEMSKQEFQKKVQSMLELQEKKKQEKKIVDIVKENDYLEKARTYEEKRRKALEDKQIMAENKRRKSEIRTMGVKKLQEKITAEEEEKRRLKTLKEEEAKRIKEKMQEETESRRRSKILQSEERVEKAKQVKAYICKRLKSEGETRNLQGKVLLSQIYQSFSKAEEQKKKLLDEGKQRFIIDFLRAEEAKETLVRKQKMREYQGLKKEEKLNQKLSNLEQIKTERSSIREHKENIQRDFKKQKSLLVTEFEKEKVMMAEEIKKLTGDGLPRQKRLCRSFSTILHKKELSPSPPSEESQYKDLTVKDSLSCERVNSSKIEKLYKKMELIYKGVPKLGAKTSYMEKEFYSAIAEEDENSFNLGLPLRLTKTMQASDDFSFDAVIKGQTSPMKRTKTSRRSSKLTRASSRDQVSETMATMRGTQSAEMQDLQIKYKRKRHLKMFVGLLELEMGVRPLLLTELKCKEQEANFNFEASAKKILRYANLPLTKEDKMESL